MTEHQQINIIEIYIFLQRVKPVRQELRKRELELQVFFHEP